MAHFAELNEANVVTRVIVVANKDTSDANGVEKEYIGAAFCERLFGGTWKQTSYNATFRKNYAGIGYSYWSNINAFVPPKPFESWVIDEDTALWVAPEPMPENPDEGNVYVWSEETTSWVQQESEMTGE